MTDAEHAAFLEQQIKALKIGMNQLRQERDVMRAQLVKLTMMLYDLDYDEAKEIVYGRIIHRDGRASMLRPPKGNKERHVSSQENKGLQEKDT